jgi:hypothetical protein
MIALLWFTPPLELRGMSSSAEPTGRISRRRWLRWASGLAATGAATGLYAWQIEPFWLETHETTIALPRLPQAFAGFRIAHLTDLHCSSVVPRRYLEGVVAYLNRALPDLVVVTGDLVTHEMQWVRPVAEILAKLRMPVLASLGNHDYAEGHAYPGIGTMIAQALGEELGNHGIRLLRNQSTKLERAPDQRLWIAGLEDLWSGRYSPAAALEEVPRDDAVIALSHNPDTAPSLDAHGVDLVLSGHTHGGQVRIPFLGPLYLNVENRRFDQGLFQLTKGKLYVSRGVGCLGIQNRFACRPEVVIHRLQRPV